MGMTGVLRWKAGGKKERKSLFRKMKCLSKVVEDHAVRYRKLLDENWSETDLTRKEAEVILRGMDHVIEQLPQARNKQDKCNPVKYCNIIVVILKPLIMHWVNGPHYRSGSRTGV